MMSPEEDHAISCAVDSLNSVARSLSKVKVGQMCKGFAQFRGQVISGRRVIRVSEDTYV